MENKRIHFIGICGSAMAPIAVEMKNIGFIVTGSDKGFFPPTSIYLQDNNMEIQLGYKKEHIQGDIDFVILGNGVSATNIEFIETKKRNIPYLSYPELLRKYLIKNESIVVAGEYGKTTITAFLSFALSKAKLNPSYMFGGISLNANNSVRINKSKYSVIEGDEYNASPIDKKSKFLYYNAKYLILTSLLWDHVDLFPKESDYISSFKTLVEGIPEDGVILINEDDESTKKIYPIEGRKIIKYSINKNSSADFYGKILKYKDGEIEFIVNNKFRFETQLIGDHNVSNLLAGIALCFSLDIKYEDIYLAVKEFLGVKRRLEIRYKSHNLVVIDDFAHSPYKIKASIDAVRKNFANSHIISVFEPHSMSSRDKKTILWYKGIFNSSNKVIVTDIYRKNSLSENIRLESVDIVDIIKSDVPNSVYVKNPDIIKSIEESLNRENDIVLFMSSGSFHGMLDKYITSLDNTEN